MVSLKKEERLTRKDDKTKVESKHRRNVFLRTHFKVVSS